MFLKLERYAFLHFPVSLLFFIPHAAPSFSYSSLTQNKQKSIFELGGDSITAVAIVNKLNAVLGKQLPVISIFESGGTILGLSGKVNGGR